MAAMSVCLTEVETNEYVGVREMVKGEIELVRDRERRTSSASLASS